MAQADLERQAFQRCYVSVVISDGSGDSKLVTFPRSRDCTGQSVCDVADNYLSLSDVAFLDMREPGQHIEIKFAAAVFNSGRALNSTCSLTITDDFISTSVKDDASRSCQRR